MNRFSLSLPSSAVLACCVLLAGSLHAANPVIPGTGLKLNHVGDDFEDPSWSFYPNLPKSSDEQDEKKRQPTGKSRNGRWYEGIKRGCPDIAQRIATPPNGPEGSTGALLLSTVHSGIPGRPSYTMQQDDFICNVWQRVGRKIAVSQTPNCVVRVFLPPIKSWENRTGATFGYRISLETHAWVVPEHKKNKRTLFGGPPRKEFALEPYWPGMFVEFRSETDRGREYDTAGWLIRGNARGREVRGPVIDTTGWWTLGMSVTPDGMVHYYIRKGLEDLTAEDYVTSQLPYGYKAETFKTFFFNVCNRDDGRTKSTQWIVDDAEMFLATPSRDMVRLVERRQNARRR